MKHYVDIEHFKLDIEDEFKETDKITITEKIDGANASFCKGENGLEAFSRREKLSGDKNLQGFLEYVKSLPQDILDDHPNYVIFGEWLVKHTVKYPEDKMKKFYVFDIWDKEKEEWCQHEIVEKFCQTKNLNMVPIFYIGQFKSWVHINSFVGKTQMGGEYGEGVVVKNMGHYKLPYNSRNITHTKIVNEIFKEKMNHHQKEVDPEKQKEKEKKTKIAKTIVTYPRVIKIIHKLEEDNILKENWDYKDFPIIAKNLPKKVFEDCLKEEKETVDIIGKDFGKICGTLSMKIVNDICEMKKTMDYDEILKTINEENRLK